MIETLPEGCTHGNIAYQTDRAVLKGFAHIDDLAMRPLRVLVSAFVRRIDDLVQLNQRQRAIETGLSAEPLMPLPVRVEAVSDERITKRTDRPPLVIVAADRPFAFAFVAGISAQIDDPLGTPSVDGVQEAVIAQASVPGHDVQLEIGVEMLQLQQKGGGGVLFPGISG